MAQDADSLKVSADATARPRLRQLLREAIRRRNYSRRTEQSYWFWIRWFIRHNGIRHPAQMGAAEVEAFLSWLATEREVAAATQNQALSALLFLYKELLGQDLPWFKDLVRAKRPVRIPAVLSRAGRVGLAVRVSLGRSIRGPGLRRDPAAPRVSGYAGPGGQGRGVTSPLDRIESEGRTRYIAKYWRQE